MVGMASRTADTFDDRLAADNRRAAAERAAAASRAHFAAAERHSRRVRQLRRWIPVVCLAVVLLALLGRFLNPFRAVPAEVTMSTLALQGAKLTMEQPKVSGFKRDAKAYEMVAETATQDIRKPNVVDMKAPVARIEMDRGSWARMSAGTGVYDSNTEKLAVKEDVKVRTDNGMEMRLSTADVDFKSGVVVSNQPVEVDLPNGWIKSERMEITDNGNRAVFEGRVRSEFRDVAPPTADDTAPATGTSQ